jgi:hypothetical protein
LTSVVLPAPVLPTIAVVVPGVTSKSRSRSTGDSAPGYEKVTSRRAIAPLPVSSVTGFSGTTTLEGVSRTSPMRSDETAARGRKNASMLAISTAIRICTR